MCLLSIKQCTYCTKLLLQIDYSFCSSTRCRLIAYSFKGGDPAARSRTATLLRLNPNRWFHLRRRPPLRVKLAVLGAPNSHGLTGGVYKTRERIHPDMLIRDY